ncbi:dihydroneopterin aldolase [Thermoflavifilum aggregans]|uniref:dihydroneopterin aldolase n=1 Tax=Thermoflavifilum aggregans TaxID=454188 RepID=A0A2M9CVW5_9BACT|nr:dihydroneopterin aldolase [Thermoflavifilum aggregans]PJJ75938.1 dihydroneopterin aldolase [Thermoflavifilum aggregans]
MQEQLTIRLNGMRFRGAYGYYPDEQRLNQEWIVDIAVHFHPEKTFATLRDTFDYEQLYIWVKELMEQPAALMETRAQEIADKLYYHLQEAVRIEVIITKPFPLLGGEIESSQVHITRTYPES